MDKEYELKRKGIELCLQACKSKLSSYTGFVHHCYEAKEDRVFDTIPVKENLSYALALLRTRQQENIAVAKELIAKLLPYYKEGFPLYLHTFLQPARMSHQLYFACLIHYLLKDFSPLLGQEIVVPLEEAFNDLKRRLKWQALQGSQKLLLEALLDLPLSPLEEKLLSPQAAGEAFLAYQISNDRGKRWLLQQLLKGYSRSLQLYVGDSRLSYEKDQLEPQLCDLFFAQAFNEFPERIINTHSTHLLASLVYPFEEELSGFNYYESCVEGKDAFTLFWGSKDHPYSLTLETRMPLKWKREAGVIEVLISIDPSSENDAPEVQGYVSDREDIDVRIGDNKGTLFYLSDTLAIRTNCGTLKLSFTTNDTLSRYIGFIRKGNRPGQKCLRKEHPFTAFDAVFGIRPLSKGENPEPLKLTLNIAGLADWVIV